jgi:hypothetical protein
MSNTKKWFFSNEIYIPSKSIYSVTTISIIKDILKLFGLPIPHKEDTPSISVRSVFQNMAELSNTSLT